MSEYERGLIASHEDEIEASFDKNQRAADCAVSKEEARAYARKPRKMPKNQRAYPKSKPRMTPITDPDELQRLLSYGPDDLGAPTLYKIGPDWAANSAELKKWRALRNPPTSEGNAK